VTTAELRQMAADGRLAPDHLLSRTPDGRQVRADSVAGLFPAPADNPFALGDPVPPSAEEAFAFGGNSPPAPPVPPSRRAKRPAADPPADRPKSGGLLDLGFTRFVTPTLVSVLWGVWLFGAVPLLTLAVLAQPVIALSRPTGPGGLGGIEAAVVAVVGLVLIGLYTLLVRVGLESVIVLFRGAEAVMAIDARQRAAGD
jgi:hypothetical protein